METQLEQIREQQKQTWNTFSSGWRKWDEFTMHWLRPMGEEIIRALRLQPTDVVLDVAAGTGEPGLTIAGLVPAGQVIITDLAEQMLAVARDNAARKGIRNYETVACDVCELPFAAASFDAVSCRFGFMFFPDMELAAREMVRVLKPGGRVATAVWGLPANNVWITTIMGTIGRHLAVPAPVPGAPGMFRCAAPGLLADLFRQAGLRNVTEKELSGRLHCGTAETYWDFMNDVAAPVVGALSQADPPTRQRIKADILALVNQQQPDNSAALEFSALIISGEK